MNDGAMRDLARAGRHFEAASEFLRASQAAYGASDPERASLLYQIALSYAALGEMCRQLEADGPPIGPEEEGGA